MGRSRSIDVADPDEGRRALVVGSAAAATAFLMAKVAGLSVVGWPSLPGGGAAAARAGRRKPFQAVALDEGFVANGPGARAVVHYVTAGGQVRGTAGLDPRRLTAVPAASDLRSIVLRLPRKLAPAAIERAALERRGHRELAELMVATGVAIDLQRPFAGERPSYRLYDLAATFALLRDFSPDAPAIGVALDGFLERFAGNPRDPGLAERVPRWRDPASPWHRKRRQILFRNGALRWSITDFDGKTRLDYRIAPVV
jgi:hypothetical protein